MKNKQNKERVSTVGRTTAPYSQAVKIKTETGGLGALKSLIVISMLAVQLAILIYLSITFALVFKWALIISFAFSLVTCIYILSADKNSLSKAVWIIFVLIFFTFGYIIYIISDERIFFRKHKRRYKAIYGDADKYITENQFKPNSIETERDCNYLYSAGKFTAYNDTKSEYLSY